MQCLLNTQVLVWNALCRLDAQQWAGSTSSLTQNHWLHCRLPGGDFSLALLASPVRLEQILNWGGRRWFIYTSQADPEVKLLKGLEEMFNGPTAPAIQALPGKWPCLSQALSTINQALLETSLGGKHLLSCWAFRLWRASYQLKTKLCFIRLLLWCCLSLPTSHFSSKYFLFTEKK